MIFLLPPGVDNKKLRPDLAPFKKVCLWKNLKGNWLFDTYIENNSETNHQKGGAYLEWPKRY